MTSLTRQSVVKILRYPEPGVADVVRHGAEVDHLHVPQSPLVQPEQEVGVAVVLEYADLKGRENIE